MRRHRDLSDKLSKKQEEVSIALAKLDKEIKQRFVAILWSYFNNKILKYFLTLIYTDGRKERLQESHQLQLFKANQRLLLDWTLKQTDEMVKKGLPKNKTEAESFIVEHQDWKVFFKCLYLARLFSRFLSISVMKANINIL